MQELKSIDVTKLKSIFPTDEGAQLEQCRGAIAPRSIRTSIDRRKFVSMENTRRAVEQIDRLPEPGEILHLILSPGAFSVFDILPAVLTLANSPAVETTLLTLGINARSLQSLCDLDDAGQVGDVLLILSHYFRGADKDEFAKAAAVFQARPRFRLAVGRSHLKVIAVKLADGRHFAASGSGNLRSCNNAEQVDVHCDPSGELFEFYNKFAHDLLRAPQ
jgi:hypothetical protein